MSLKPHENFTCNDCGEFLCRPPVRVASSGIQLCGSCYEARPEDEKRGFVREVGFEAALEILKLHSSEEDEEKSESGSSVWEKLIFLEEHEGVKTELELSIKESGRRGFILKYDMNLEGVNDNLCLISEQEKKNIKIQLEGTLALRNEPNLIYSKLNVSETNKIINNNQQPTNSSSNRRCISCNATLTREVYSCSLSHEACTNCKGKFCFCCSSPVNPTPIYHCRNYGHGCDIQRPLITLTRHETDCEYNSFRCPIAGCSFRGALKALKAHIEAEHSLEVVLAEEVRRTAGNADDSWVMYAHGNVFKCKFFYFKEFVEVLVVYVGAQENARRWRYEVEVVVNGRVLRRGGRCFGWNGVALDNGVTFNKADVQELMGQKKNYKFDFDYVVKIFEGGVEVEI